MKLNQNKPVSSRKLQSVITFFLGFSLKWSMEFMDLSNPYKSQPSWEPAPGISRMMKYRNTYRYAPPNMSASQSIHDCGSGPEFERFFQLDYNVRSRLNEDKIIYNALFHQNSVSNNISTSSMPVIETIVELGAYNGYQESNSHFFEQCLGWKTLLIEGNPENFEKAIVNRPHGHRMSFAPSCSAEYEQVNRTIQFYKYPLTNVGLVGHAITYEGKPTVDVPCGPLGPVLEDVFQSEGKRVTFFSLDVEGAEPLVLNTIDFDKVLIEVLMIEVVNANCNRGRFCETRNKVRAKMAAHGYQRYEGFVHASDIYVHPQSRYQMPSSVQRAA